MRIHFLRFVLILGSLILVNPAFSDQKIKTKSNIKNDRVQQPTTSDECTGNDCKAAVDCVTSEKQEGTAKDSANSDCKKNQQAESSSDSTSAE